MFPVTEMSSHVSVIFKSGRFHCRSFPLCFCERILISVLNLCKEYKPMIFFVYLNVLKKMKR